MIKDVLPFKSSFNPFCKSSSVSVSMLDVASSKIRIFGSASNARAKEMSALADRLERQFLESQVGTVQTVLIEKRISPDYCNGFTGSYIPVRIYGGDIPRHSLVQVKLTSADGTYCTGTTKF